jgi:hypothetical protein
MGVCGTLIRLKVNKLQLTSKKRKNFTTVWNYCKLRRRKQNKYVNFIELLQNLIKFGALTTASGSYGVRTCQKVFIKPACCLPLMIICALC